MDALPVPGDGVTGIYAPPEATSVVAAADAPLLRGLFPAAVGAAELCGGAVGIGLWPAEAQAVERAVPGRVREFAAGRACARVAMAQLGHAPVAVPSRPDRAPAWPTGLVGSITHTSGYCAAVVASASLYVGIGIDVEQVGTIDADLWSRLYTPTELDWLQGQSDAWRDEAAALLFCAKEAFYKSQYPSTGRWLEFDDVEVEVHRPADGIEVGTYTIRVVGQVSPACFPSSAHGRYCTRGGLLLASAWVEQSGGVT